LHFKIDTLYTIAMQNNNVITDWLHRRKITDKVIEDFNIGTDTSGRIIIPIRNSDGDFVFNKYRRNPLREEGNKYTYESGGSVTLFAYDKAKSYDTILFCEGEIDALVSWSANIPAVSSTGGAMSFKQDWIEYFSTKSIILCFDNDEAGGNGMAKALEIVPHAKILFLPDRPGVKDISDYVTSGGNLQTLLQSAVRLSSMEAIIAHRNDRVALWQSTFFHDAYIRYYTEKPKQSRDVGIRSDDRVIRAKQYPIDTLVSFTVAGKAKCLFHNEKTQSMHYYADTNVCYCFGCSKRADAIDIYMILHNCSFLEAVSTLQ